MKGLNHWKMGDTRTREVIKNAKEYAKSRPKWLPLRDKLWEYQAKDDVIKNLLISEENMESIVFKTANDALVEINKGKTDDFYNLIRDIQFKCYRLFEIRRDIYNILFKK